MCCSSAIETRYVIGVVETLSDADDTDPNELPALAETVDPESLNDICANASARDPVAVTFDHAGYDVTVRSDGFVGVDSA